MKTIFYKLLLIAMLCPGLIFCSTDFNGKHTKEKKISKKFNVSANSNLKVDNSYGNIDISTWEQNKVSIEVFIKTNGNDEQKVKEKLEEINISFNQSSSGVSAKTHFTKENKSWWDNLFGDSNNINIEVNYIIKAPENNNVDLKNDYGGIYIDRLLGNAKIACDYGKIDIDELHGNSNYLNFNYTRNSHIGYLKNAEINADYSGFVIEEAENIKLNADYTSSKFLKVANLDFNCDYGEINVEKVKKLVGNGDYLSTKIGRVFTSVDLNLDYGSASIEKLIKGMRSAKIHSDYTGVKIGYDAEQAFNFIVNTSYGDVKGIDELEVEKRQNKTTSKKYEGYHLRQNSGNHVDISTSYGSVSFKKR